MHQLLTQAAVQNPVVGNAQGSYLTMRSKNGLIFGVINIIGNCMLYRLIEVRSSSYSDFVVATVFQDQAYWQRAIASRPATSVRAFMMGGLAWFVYASDISNWCELYKFRFAIPFMFSTTMGLAAVALRGDPDMRVLTPADISAGLPAPSAAAALLGQSGAVGLLIVLFLAVTSATSAELIAVSSILTYDIYKASSDQIALKV
jgi:Na+/proline symporter